MTPCPRKDGPACCWYWVIWGYEEGEKKLFMIFLRALWKVRTLVCEDDDSPSLETTSGPQREEAQILLRIKAITLRNE